jgi:hypothetical protein
VAALSIILRTSHTFKSIAYISVGVHKVITQILNYHYHIHQHTHFKYTGKFSTISSSTSTHAIEQGNHHTAITFYYEVYLHDQCYYRTTAFYLYSLCDHPIISLDILKCSRGSVRVDRMPLEFLEVLGSFLSIPISLDFFSQHPELSFRLFC